MQTKQNIYDLDTPALLVDLDQLEHNISDMANLATVSAKKLRPHTKTHKSPLIANMQIASGASGITVAKLGEAEVMADHGLTDIFIANQIVGQPKLSRLAALHRRADLHVAVDSVDGVQILASAAFDSGQPLKLLIEVDTGLNRAGCRTPEEVAEVAKAIHKSSGLKLEGVFTHEGHLYRGKNGVDPAEAHMVGDRIRAAADALRNQGIDCDVVSVGSTPGAPLMARERGISELRPGVYVFSDRTQVSRGGDPKRQALYVLASVVSVRPNGVAIIDAGSKAMASDCPFEDRTYGAIVGRDELVFQSISEEHGHLHFASDTNLRVGDKLLVIPNHACTCVNMHDTMVMFRGEQVEMVTSIACRGKLQ